MKKIALFFLLLLQPIIIFGQNPDTDPALRQILAYFDERSDPGFEDIVARAQSLWYQPRERWLFDQRYEELRNELWPLFQELGFIEERQPAHCHYEAGLVHGALLSSFRYRFCYLIDLWNRGIRFESIVFLTGERLLLESEREQTGLETETEMCEWVYSTAHMPDGMRDIPLLVISAPMKQKADGSWTRPQTVDTVTLWLQSQPKAGSYLAISHQPYIAQQNAAMRLFSPPEVQFETVGPEAFIEPSVALILDSIARWLYQESLCPKSYTNYQL